MLVCLANSIKLGEYCFAGVDPETYESIRPIGSGPHGAVTCYEQEFADGRIATLLDVVSVPLDLRWRWEGGAKLYAEFEHSGRSHATGAPNYQRMANEPDTRAALDEVAELAGEHTIALMCSESRPEECHRSRMLEPELAGRGVGVEHILHSGEAAARPTLFT